MAPVYFAVYYHRLSQPIKESSGHASDLCNPMTKAEDPGVPRPVSSGLPNQAHINAVSVPKNPRVLYLVDRPQLGLLATPPGALRQTRTRLPSSSQAPLMVWLMQLTLVNGAGEESTYIDTIHRQGSHLACLLLHSKLVALAITITTTDHRITSQSLDSITIRFRFESSASIYFGARVLIAHLSSSFRWLLSTLTTPKARQLHHLTS